MLFLFEDSHVKLKEIKIRRFFFKIIKRVSYSENYEDFFYLNLVVSRGKNKTIDNPLG